MTAIDGRARRPPAPTPSPSAAAVEAYPSGLGLGVAVMWFSLLVLIPLCAVVVETSRAGGPSSGTRSPTRRRARRSGSRSPRRSLVTLLNVVMGTLIAWVLVRDHFSGKRALEVLIDIPFALPTIVAGLVLLSLYGPKSPIDLDLANTRPAIFLAFAVRHLAVRRAHRAAGARRARPRGRAGRDVARRQPVHGLPARRAARASLPAIAAGAALSFARAISEYGSLVLLSGNLPMQTEVTSVRMLSYIENGNMASAAAVATILLSSPLVVIVTLDVIQRRVARRG